MRGFLKLMGTMEGVKSLQVGQARSLHSRVKKRIDPNQIEIYQTEYDTSELGFEGMLILETLSNLDQSLEHVIQLLTYFDKPKGGMYSAQGLAQAWEALRLAGYTLPIRIYTSAVERCAVVSTE